jgi:PAS domain S-box-containing protein
MLKRLLTPSFIDSDTNPIGDNLYKIILAVLLFVTVTYSSALIFQHQFTRRYILMILLTYFVSLIAIFLLKKGYTKSSAYFYILCLLIFIIGFAWTAGGIQGNGIRLLPILVLIAGLTIGRKEIILFGVIVSSCTLCLIIANHFNLLFVKEPIKNSDFVNWVYSTTFIFLLCFVEYMSLGRLNKALSEAKAEIALRKKSEEKYRLIFESFQDVYYQTDLDGKILIITPSVKYHTGYEVEEIIEKNVNEFYVNPNEREYFLNELKLRGSVLNYELDLKIKNGKIINVIISCKILYDENGTPKNIEGTIHDITQRKNAENIIKLKNEKLTEVAFLQSHIVRRPIANILGVLHLINKNNPTDPINSELLPKLEEISKDLDDVIKQIVQKTKEIDDMN